MSQPPHSNRSSVEPSSSPTSPSPSPAGAPPDPPKPKRTRASKPKVRTGSSKIRRVKCDEGKPACLRCTSTGRTCDGYDKFALSRYNSPGTSQAAERARAEFDRACEWNESLRSMRRIEADIDGTETEKRLFARFRATTAGRVPAQFCNFAAFWSRLNPLTGSQDEAVKHAVVALAAAYQLFQHPNEPAVDGLSRADLEVLTIQHYNQSIERLQTHAGSSAVESVRITLICCLAFVSLESVRGNHEVAVTHLTNGLRILQSLPDSAFDFLADRSVFLWSSDLQGGSLQIPDIIRLFARFERSACFFTHGVQPVVSERAYRARRFDDGSADSLFPDVAHARMAMSCFQHDVMARMHEIATAAAVFWADPVQQRQQACLVARSARLGLLVDDFFSPSRFGTPDPTSPELFALYLDLIYFFCAQFLVANAATAAGIFTLPNATPLPAIPQHANHHLHHPIHLPLSPLLTDDLAAAPATRLLHPILRFTSRLFTASISQQQQQQPQQPARAPTTLHTHLLGPLYLVAAHIPDPRDPTRAAAVDLLGQILAAASDDEGGWRPSAAAATAVDARAVEEALDTERKTRMRTGGAGGPGGGVPRTGSSAPPPVGRHPEPPRALMGPGCLPFLWDALVRQC
ncbi:hypothetical protein VTH06DRAFT_2419 [Thermothelomyces fergusii]